MTSRFRVPPTVLRWVVYLAVFFVSFGSFLSTTVKDGVLRAPPEAGDGHDFEALAFNLWRHGRFGFDWSDPEWRRPYERVPGYDSLLERQSEFYPTTYRPPAAPAVMAIVFAATDRSFAAWRVAHCAIMAGAVTLAAAIAAEIAGLAAAPAAMAVALALPLLRLFAHEFRTEGVAALFVTLLAWMWIRNGEKGWTGMRCVTSGVVLGVLAMSRSIFLLWIPLTMLAPGADRASGRAAWRGRALAVAVALLVIGPWWIRNCVVLEAFLPFGTQGAINLPAGFGPRALRFKGQWMSNPGDGAEEVDALNLGPVASEVWLAKHRSALAARWVRDNPVDALRLMGMHVWQEVKPRRLPYPTGAWLLPLAAVGAIVLRRSAGVRVVVVMVAANMLGIALTWSARGQFMAPIQPLLAALVGALAVAVVRAMIALAGRLRL
ncbi:MAG TPA: hypothetical protein VFQ51_18025 [Vicinamibacteria bacterium]|nr:hypothetical protein [Vicinamibacteria bacterium]